MDAQSTVSGQTQFEKQPTGQRRSGKLRTGPEHSGSTQLEAEVRSVCYLSLRQNLLLRQMSVHLKGTGVCTVTLGCALPSSPGPAALLTQHLGGEGGPRRGERGSCSSAF